ncbi:MAG: AraC family transcriptional regulator ligand-binding domain-containing protein [Sphingomonadales bacterium]|nr:AraC family transcriptional regulator ligand-binding domain-containing protein [Sphingomonadales bacterium]
MMEGAPELVAELGGDYRALAREAGVPQTPMANPDLPMRVDRFTAFMELAATRLGEPAFGLRLGPYQSLSLFGPMAPLLGSAANVRSMIMDIADFFPLHTQGTIVGVEPTEGALLLTYELSTEVGSQQRQVIELGFSVIAREMRRHDPMWKPDMVTMRHSPPKTSPGTPACWVIASCSMEIAMRCCSIRICLRGLWPGPTLRSMGNSPRNMEPQQDRSRVWTCCRPKP